MNPAHPVAVAMPLVVILTVMGTAFLVAITSLVMAKLFLFTSRNSAWTSPGTLFLFAPELFLRTPAKSSTSGMTLSHKA
jgi:hypothetical protein